MVIKKSNLGISVFFPAYNDGGSIASMVINAIMTLKKITNNYEVIVVDDGSKDNTGQIIDELAKKYRHVRAIHHKVNKGYGGALRTGFASARKELIFYTDGDAQYDVRELANLVPLMKEGVDVVNGYKIKRSDPLHRKIVGKLYHYSVKFAFGLKIKDVDCDFRLIRKKVFEKVHLKSNTGVICVELMKKIQSAGFNVQEIGVHHYHRMHGKSQFFNFSRIAKTLIALAKLWVETVLLKNY